MLETVSGEHFRPAAIHRRSYPVRRSALDDLPIDRRTSRCPRDRSRTRRVITRHCCSIHRSRRRRVSTRSERGPTLLTDLPRRSTLATYSPSDPSRSLLRGNFLFVSPPTSRLHALPSRNEPASAVTLSRSRSRSIADPPLLRASRARCRASSTALRRSRDPHSNRARTISPSHTSLSSQTLDRARFLDSSRARTGFLPAISSQSLPFGLASAARESRSFSMTVTVRGSLPFFSFFFSSP